MQLILPSRLWINTISLFIPRRDNLINKYKDQCSLFYKHNFKSSDFVLLFLTG